jgi:adenine-specific DNA-methyltransferase
MFDFPKPISLLKEIVKGSTFFSKKDNNIILDSFSSSGTTAHAILSINKEDGGNRKFILFYEPDIEKLKNVSLTLKRAKSIGKPEKKRRLVFAPTKYLDQTHLDELRIDFAQLPFEIYELAR